MKAYELASDGNGSSLYVTYFGEELHINALQLRC